MWMIARSCLSLHSPHVKALHCITPQDLKRCSCVSELLTCAATLSLSAAAYASALSCAATLFALGPARAGMEHLRRRCRAQQAWVKLCSDRSNNSDSSSAHLQSPPLRLSTGEVKGMFRTQHVAVHQASQSVTISPACLLVQVTTTAATAASCVTLSALMSPWLADQCRGWDCVPNHCTVL